MNDPKPLASLGPSLLARKGSAKPAMRPQAPGFAPVGNKAAAQSLEDLGWNDMGEDDAAADHSAEVLQLTPAPHNPEAEAKTDKGSPKPKVRTMHEELEARLAKLPKRSEYVAYCRGPYCIYADRAVELLRASGRRARRLEAGFPEWKAAGLPTARAVIGP